MVHTAFKQCNIYVFGTYKSNVTLDQIKEWIRLAGGKSSTSLTDQTTHAIVPDKSWREEQKPVKEIQNANKAGQNIHILRYEWLENSLSKKTRLSENKYSWERMEKRGDGAQNLNEPQTAVGLMSELFTDSTNMYVDRREKQRIDKKQRQEDEDRKEQAEHQKRDFENRRNEYRVMEVAAVFRRGAQKARSQLLSDNYHIYMDSTGFTYNVLMTKAGTERNTGERYTITIYESNFMPHTYAVNGQFTVTGKIPQRNVIAVMGSTYETAYRAFKKIFKEKTHICWDDRLAVAFGRRTNENYACGLRSSGPSSPLGIVLERGDDFTNTPYLYEPPLYGPSGGHARTQGQGLLETAGGQHTIQEDNEGSMNGVSCAGLKAMQTDFPAKDFNNDIDLYRFMYGTQDYAGTMLEGITDDALDDPFDFGIREKHTAFDELIADQNAKDQTEANPGQDFDDAMATDIGLAIDHTQDFNYTQIAEQVDEDKYGRDNEMPIGKPSMGKRKELASQVLSQDALVGKKPKRGETDEDLQQTIADGQYAFGTAWQVDEDTPRTSRGVLEDDDNAALAEVDFRLGETYKSFEQVGRLG